MNIKVMSIVGIALIAVATVLGTVFGMATMDILAISSAAYALFMAVMNIAKKYSNIKPWKVWTSIATMVVGCIVLAFSGGTEETAVTVIGAVAVLAGVLIPLVFKKETNWINWKVIS